MGSHTDVALPWPDVFYVVLTNISEEPQPVFETWNSWGYKSASFEVETADGHKFAISKKPQKFTVNFPSTFLFLPVSIWFTPSPWTIDGRAVPRLPMADETPIPITIRAVYEMGTSQEARQRKSLDRSPRIKQLPFQIQTMVNGHSSQLLKYRITPHLPLARRLRSTVARKNVHELSLVSGNCKR